MIKGSEMACNRSVVFISMLIGLSVTFVGCGRHEMRGEQASTVADTTEKNVSKRPNILLVVVDDMGYTDLGAFGSEINTPNIDQLASDGLRLTNFHAAPACAPTRAMLISGMDNHSAGVGAMDF